MEKDIIVTCPYDKAHRIRRYKLMSHITKCKKQYGATDKVACPLNSSHIVDHDAVKDHLSSCSNLSCLIQNNVEEKIDVAPVMSTDAYTSAENWNDLPEVPTYNAMANAASKKVIRCMSGLTKSERLKYRMSERERFANLNGVSSTVGQTRTLREETIHEIEARPRPPRQAPPCDIAQTENNTKVSQKVSNKSAQKQNSDADLTKSTTTNEFRDIFQKTLYNELLPDCKPDEGWKDSTFNESQYVKSKDCVKTSNNQQKLMEHSVANNDTSNKSFNYPGPSGMSSERENKKEKSLLLADQNQEVENKKKQKNVTDVDASCDIFSVNTSKREIEHTENTRANTSNERVTDKLLSLLMDKTEKIELAGKTKENDKNDEKDEKDKYDNKNACLEWEDVICKLTDRLDHLTNAQNIAAKQSAQLAKEVSDLKHLKRCCNTPLSAVLSNSRCAANFIEPMSPMSPMSPPYPTHTKNHNVPEEAPMFFGNVPNSYNANRDNDMFNLRDNSKLPELKTPKDFGHC